MPEAVTEKVAVWPAVTLWLAGWVVIDGVPATPVPVSTIVVGVLDTLLEAEMLPEALPVAAGAKVAEKVALCPAASESGSAGVLNPNPVPDTVACKTVIAAVPEFVRVKLSVPVKPTSTFPKLKLGGMAARAE